MGLNCFSYAMRAALCKLVYTWLLPDASLTDSRSDVYLMDATVSVPYQFSPHIP